MIQLCLGIFLITRIILLILTGINSVPLPLWPMIFIKGVWFDLTTTILLLSPVFFVINLLPLNWKNNFIYKLGTKAFMFVASFFLLLLMVIEISFWMEFSTRLNFIAVDYLLYTHEVIKNIRESYPLPLIFLSIAFGGALLSWKWKPGFSVKRKKYAILLSLALPGFLVMASRIEQMDFSQNTYANELSGNGIFTFAAALRRNELDYDKFYLTLPQHDADIILKALDVERTPLENAIKTLMFDESDDIIPFPRKFKNIVLVSVESLSASFLGSYGSDENLTPHLDKLFQEGLVFDRFYATGTRTVRGLEALSLGTPPVPGQSIVRRPHNNHLSTLGEILSAQGYWSAFFYGGFGYFDNMNSYFQSNSYAIFDRHTIPDDKVIFENAWGVADEVLFNHVIQTLNNRSDSRPFFAHIMTTSNHRPYTYPAGRINISSPGGRAGAIKYTDFSIAQFIETAKKQAWFKNTLFVITADHCANVAGKSKLPLKNYRIPLLFYNPETIKPGHYRHFVSQIDLMPTLIEILGKKGDDHFFGRSFFDEGPQLERIFISNYQELGYFRKNILTVLLPGKKVQCFELTKEDGEQEPRDCDRTLVNESIAYYQTASRAFKEGALKITPSNKILQKT